jgi:hypothetical protein
MRARKLLVGALAAFGLSAGTASAAIIDLAFALDDSGSMSVADYTLEKQGLANALALVPTAGPDQYRISVVAFSTAVTTVVAPTILTAGNLAGIQALINADPYDGQLTNLAGAINQLVALTAAAGIGATSLMNISTDGAPTVGTPNPDAAATNARNAALAAGWDSISFEAIGAIAADIAFMQTLAFPHPAIVTNNPAALPNPLAQGFVLTVDNFQDYGPAIASKIQVIVVRVPEPGTIGLLALGLLAAGFSVRRRAGR